MNKTITNCQDIPGFNNKFHTDCLEEVCRTLPENSRVLEIGVGWGSTSWAILDNLPKGCEFHSCDTFALNSAKSHHYKGVFEKHSDNPVLVELLNIYMRADQKTLYDHVISLHPRKDELFKQVHTCPSLSLLSKDVRWDMVYIDGWHAYDNVRAELEYLKNVPVLCGDDYHPVHPGVVRAVDEFLATQKRIFWNDERPKSGFWKAIKQ